MSEKELEERVLINKKQFLELKQFIQEQYPDFVTTEQKNRYLDDDKFTVHERKNMLRIRSFHHSKMRELTYKVGGKDGDIEYTLPLTYYWFTQITRFSRLPNGEVKDQLVKDGVNINSLHTLTELRTRRIEVKLREYTIVLDANVYNNISDYNLEIESKLSKSHAKKVILEFCEQFGIQYKNDYPTKIRRVMESLFKSI